jgi:hypothetical protein
LQDKKEAIGATVAFETSAKTQSGIDIFKMTLWNCGTNVAVPEPEPEIRVESVYQVQKSDCPC